MKKLRHCHPMYMELAHSLLQTQSAMYQESLCPT